jgi:hypothetical protein
MVANHHRHRTRGWATTTIPTARGGRAAHAPLEPSGNLPKPVAVLACTPHMRFRRQRGERPDIPEGTVSPRIER